MLSLRGARLNLDSLESRKRYVARYDMLLLDIGAWYCADSMSFEVCCLAVFG